MMTTIIWGGADDVDDYTDENDDAAGDDDSEDDCDADHDCDDVDYCDADDCDYDDGDYEDAPLQQRASRGPAPIQVIITRRPRPKVSYVSLLKDNNSLPQESKV